MKNIPQSNPPKHSVTPQIEDELQFPHLPEDVSKNEISNLLESISDGFYLLDKNWNVRYFNKQAELILGINRNEILGRNLWEYYPEEMNKGFFKQFHAAVDTQTTIRFEEYLERVDIWGELIAYPSSEGLSVYFKDITDRKRKEKELFEMNNNYRLLTRATSGAIWEYNLQNDYCYWHDENFRELFGHDIVNANVPHSFWESLIHPDDKPETLNHIVRQLEEEIEVSRIEYRLKRADGSYANVLERTFLVKNERNIPIKLIGCTEDITAFKAAENELRKSESNYRHVFQKSPLPQYICIGDSLKIIMVNKAAIDLYGYSEKEFLNFDIRNFVRAEAPAALINCIQQSRNTNETCNYIDTHLKKSGEKIIVEVTTANMIYDNQACFLVTLNDQTKRIQLEKEISEVRLSAQKNITKATIDGQEKQREEIGKELHDNVNQILATAKLYLGCALSDGLPNNQLIHKTMDSIGYCIDEIRRLSHTLIPPSLGEITLEEAISDLIARIQFLKGEIVNVDIFGLAEEELSDGLKTTIYRIIQEQLHNILKYAEASHIVISIRHRDNNVNLLISDNGIGFNVKEKRKGIGLTNIINRADLYNGSVNIDSSPGEGCSIVVKFMI